jgi:hypothetical protein
MEANGSDALTESMLPGLNPKKGLYDSAMCGRSTLGCASAVVGILLTTVNRTAIRMKECTAPTERGFAK